MEQAKAEKAKLESMTQLDKLGTEFELRQAKEAIENLEKKEGIIKVTFLDVSGMV